MYLITIWIYWTEVWIYWNVLSRPVLSWHTTVESGSQRVLSPVSDCIQTCCSHVWTYLVASRAWVGALVASWQATQQPERPIPSWASMVSWASGASDRSLKSCWCCPFAQIRERVSGSTGYPSSPTTDSHTCYPMAPLLDQHHDISIGLLHVSLDLVLFNWVTFLFVGVPCG